MTEEERRRGARDRILAAAVRRIASEGVDGVRIARIAMDAGVSPALVHYHFATREALLAEALDYSYARAGERRIAEAVSRPASHAVRLAEMIDGCLPSSAGLCDDWMLWVELWLRAARSAELRPYAAELYARLHVWFSEEIEAGIRDGEFERCDADEVADRALALIDGVGVRALAGDPQMSLARARRTIGAALARELGVGEQLPFTQEGDLPSPQRQLA
jgi:AcrR family transcriptional regulator